MTESEQAVHRMIDMVLADGGDGDGWIQTDNISAVVQVLEARLPKWQQDRNDDRVVFQNDQECIVIARCLGPRTCERVVSITKYGIEWLKA